MVARISTICSVVAVALCLPVATWTFVTQQNPQHQPIQHTSSSSSSASSQPQLHLQQHHHHHPQLHTPFGVVSDRLSYFGPLFAKRSKQESAPTPDDDDEDVDPLESDGWEPDEADLIEEDIDLDELDLDDVENSVTGLEDDYIDDDDIEYEDDDEVVEEEDNNEFEDDDDDEGIDEEDDDVDDDDDEELDEDDYDIEDSDELNALLESNGMTEKPPEGFNKWWEDYGFDSKEDFENHELFPGGMADMVDRLQESPDKDFWDDEVTMVPLLEDEDGDDESDYNTNLKRVLESSKKRLTLANARAKEEARLAERPRFGGEDVINDGGFDDNLEELGGELEEIEKLSKALDEAIPDDSSPNGAKDVTLDASDLEGMDVREEMMKAPALFDDEPYEGKNRTNIAGTGITDEEMKALDRSWKRITETTGEEPWNKVAATGVDFDYDKYPKQYHYDMQETAVEIGSASYNVYPWLKYDMGFNVSNLILASVKHNPDAPVILQHWYPQLMVCERYQHARDRNFDFTWEDVNGADMEELERYYYGFGYEEIPKKAPSETGIISLEDADEQETKMAAMEKWMLDVYNSEWDRKDFDDEDIKDEDNVFSDKFRMPQHPDLPEWDDAQEDIGSWKDEFSDEENAVNGDTEEAIRYRDTMGRSIDFEPDQDDDFQKNFKGHLVVACGNFDEDLEVAERITERMEKEFGNAIYTETKIYNHATPSDNLFEVWLESYEIDLLHSKRRAFMGVDGWEGKADVDTERMDYLVREISQLTGDDARNSYRWSEEHVS